MATSAQDLGPSRSDVLNNVRGWDTVGGTTGASAVPSSAATAGRVTNDHQGAGSPAAVGAAATSGIQQAWQSIAGTQQSNNAFNAEQAAINRKWQEEQARVVRDFNAEQASKNRDWQAMMSNTAHQREIRDLKAAGLNPVLSATGGQGAAVTSGATASGVMGSGSSASADTSASGAFSALLGSYLNTMTSLANQAVSAQTNLAVADKYNAMSKYTSELAAQTQLTSANISAMSNQYVAQIHAGAAVSAAQMSAEAAKISASIHAAAQRYGYDVNAMTQRDIAAFNADVNRDLKEMQLKTDFDIAKLQTDTQKDTAYYGKDVFGSGITGGMIGDISKAISDLFSGNGFGSQFAGGSAGGGGRRK